MIIGVIGKYASGKDCVAKILEEQGFIHYSLSDEIRAEAKQRKLKITRDVLINLGNELREKFGSSILSERVRSRIHGKRNYVLSSLRNVEEVNALLDLPEFVLVRIEADAKKRFEWLSKRSREEDPETFKEFQEKEKLESSSDSTKQQLHKVMKLAKIIIKNEGSLEDLREKTLRMLHDLSKKHHKRPSWDEYFMGIVEAVSTRATCDRGRTAVVLVKNKLIIATGYVGSPIGMPHCDDVGHQMKKMIHEDERITQHCVRTNHGEVNAISLAAKNGVSTDGATLYCKLEPCYTCAKMLINSGIIRVVCQKLYHAGQDSRELFKLAGIPVTVLENTVEEYSNQ